jgi:mono/diheme cytochrome c family protein
MSTITFNSYGQDGASIFKKNCGVCHTIGKGKIVGPDLKGVDKKYELKWLIDWVKSSQTMINKKKDPIAIKIFNDNNQMVMPDQDVSDEEITTLVAYIGEETVKLEQPQAPATVATVTPTEQIKGNQADSNSSESTLNQLRVPSSVLIYILIGIIVFLTLLVIRLAKVIKVIIATQKAKDS